MVAIIQNIILEEEVLYNVRGGQVFRGFDSNCVISFLTIKVIFSNEITILYGAIVF